MAGRAAHFKFFMAGLFVLASTLVLQKNAGFSDAPNTLLERIEPRTLNGSYMELHRSSRSNFLTGFFAVPGQIVEHSRISDSVYFDKGRIGVLHFLRPLYILLKILII